MERAKYSDWPFIIVQQKVTHLLHPPTHTSPPQTVLQMFPEDKPRGTHCCSHLMEVATYCIVVVTCQAMSYFTSEKTEPQRSEVTCLKSHSHKVAELGESA